MTGSNPLTGDPDVERDGRPYIAARDVTGAVILIQRSATRDHLSKDLALQQFFDVWLNDRCTLGDIAGNLTCSEMEALADLLAAHGHHDAADDMRTCHVEHDDQGDLDHNTIEERADEPSPRGHDARPDDDPEPGDRCKDCGDPITWRGPALTDWHHVDEETTP